MENEEIRNPEVSAAAEPVANQNLNTAAEDAISVEGDAVAVEAEDAVAVEAPAPERKPRPQIEVTDEMIEKSSKTLSTMLDFLGLEGTVKTEKRPSKINLLISSEDAGRIIGRKGQSLESLQLLLNRMMQNGNEDFPKVYIDIDGYSSNGKTVAERRPSRERAERRERGERRGGRRFDSGKEDILQQQALDAAKEVRRWGESVTLPAMNSHDRRIIHITLENEPDLHTESIGDGAMKSVVVSLKK
ncbi:MAG: R3H domain-containing nucleic acid-binding protein [Victivallales bacterium]|nr:R3H domain-containing nucleic acid-binding protein [Victivallales bacterium]